MSFALRCLVTLFVISGLAFLFIPQSAFAADDDLHVKMEISNDDGATWHNYSGTEFHDGESVTLEPGEQFKFRIKLWNTQTELEGDMTDITGYMYFTFDPSIVPFESGLDIDPDADHNDNDYSYGGPANISDFSTADPISGMIDVLYAGGTEGTAEICEFTAQVLPESELESSNIFTVTTRILSYEPFMPVGNTNNVSADVNFYSSARGTVNYTEEELVSSGMKIAFPLLISFFLSISGWLIARKLTD